MKIISDFKDYYDVGIGAGHDPEPVYKRFQKSQRLPRQSRYRRPLAASSFWAAGWVPSDLYTVLHTIWFCGTPCRVIEINALVNVPFFSGPPGRKERETRKFCYTVADVSAAVGQFLTAKAFDEWVDKVFKRDKYRYRSLVANLEVADPTTTSNAWLEKALAMRCPVFVLQPDPADRSEAVVTFNAQLTPYGFARVVDPYRAYQEISMYLNNLAEPGKPIPSLDDETMAEIKGFDKTSFRKEPTTKKRRPGRA